MKNPIQHYRHLYDANDPALWQNALAPTMRSRRPGYSIDQQEERMSIDDLMLKERIIFIGKTITDYVAYHAITLMLYLHSDDSTKDISLYINSPGGVISSGMGIYDTMQYVKPDVSTFCIGKAMSMGSILLAAGAPGKRFCLPNATIMIHQPLISGTLTGQASDIEIEAREMVRIRSTLYELMEKHTGQPLDRIARDMDRNNFMTAQQALAYGIVDEILTSTEK